ncbi:AraC family transcriptional regulator [Paenibacillus silvisoli]|uniref:AraC family transcriptional regulator n=1 Tax=Paenibacillus silvisoli TaxID=3110539 RepID=UPI0028042E58|nr:AraC family transcriptional regulator [Paenibacillus silvisoli]
MPLLLHELLQTHPFHPYIRTCNYAVRSAWHSPERRLLDYLLVYFQEGHCVFQVDGEEYDFYPGDCCLVQPGSLKVMHGVTATSTPYAHLDIFSHPLRAESFPTRAGQTDLRDYMHLMQPRLNDIEGINVPVRLNPQDPNQFSRNLIQMIACWRNPNPLRQLEAQTLASQLVTSILYDHTEIYKKSAEPIPSISWLPSYLSLHLNESITVEDMASRANLSISRFRELFRQHFGAPPHRYLLDLRIRYAKELLLNTDYSIEKIAEYCGFSDIHHFSNTFKKMEAVTPNACRKAGRSLA